MIVHQSTGGLVVVRVLHQDCVQIVPLISRLRRGALHRLVVDVDGGGNFGLPVLLVWEA